MTKQTSDTSSNSSSPFEFGKNWQRFLGQLSEDRIRNAEESLKRLVLREDFQGCRFLDAGSGSGLFSLAAHRLGSMVVSFDADPDSVACTQEIRRRYAKEAETWKVSHGSLLDKAFLDTLGDFDFVYCWGVAHHTGSMWTAIDNLIRHVKPGGTIVLAIYNDQLYISRAWRAVKLIYQKLPVAVRPIYVFMIGAAAFVKRLGATLLACLVRLLTLRNPFVPILNWAGETQARGMHGWYDLVDWVGGWPFEVAKPEDIFRFMRDRGFTLSELTTCAGHGCNEFAFSRTTAV